MTTTIPISWFPSLTDPRPRNVTIDLGTQPGAFVTHVSDLPCAKRELPLWAPAMFAGNRRLKSEVASVSALVLDVDEGAGDIGTFSALIARGAPVHWTIHSSFSATPECWKWRAIAAVSRPMSPTEHGHVWRTMQLLLANVGITIDAQCKDPSRAYFVPWVPASGLYVTTEVPGEPLDVDAWATRGERPIAATSAHLSNFITGNGTAFERARAYVACVPGAISGAGGHAHTFKLALKLVRGFNLPENDAMQLMTDWNATCSPPWLPAELVRKVRQALEQGQMQAGAMLARGAA
jgi:hypothetical protein